MLMLYAPSRVVLLILHLFTAPGYGQLWRVRTAACTLEQDLDSVRVRTAACTLEHE